MRTPAAVVWAVWAVLALTGLAAGETLKVGPGQRFARPSAAIAAAGRGDVIEIAPGEYANDYAVIRADGLTLRGVGGAGKGARPVLSSKGLIPNGKAIWVIAGRDTVVENVEFTGARVADRNGAGIRQEGRNLTLRGCKFADCEDGLLTGADPQSDILIEGCEFAHDSLDGQSHNLYVGAIRKLTFQFNYTHHAHVAHLLKSRARENHILYNRISDEADGSSSYQIDLPNGGKAYAVGNVIHQGPRASNSGMLSYGAEGMKYDANELYVINNTFINDLGKGTFLQVSPRGKADVPVVAANNIFLGAGVVCSYPQAAMKNNVTADPKFVNRATWDLRVAAGSPCLNAGTLPGRSAAGVDLAPVFQYAHPCSSRKRTDMGKTVGAYEPAAAK
ncbi:MAG: right-handed parallel beta-helix repeat-containing protein [Planctomycetota bacterium]|nr:right-handed parallel beta-helix repeat-containing protein [Planctomycetota bacterium]